MNIMDRFDRMDVKETRDVTKIMIKLIHWFIHETYIQAVLEIYAEPI